MQRLRSPTHRPAVRVTLSPALSIARPPAIPTSEQVSKEHSALEENEKDASEKQEVQKWIDGVDEIPVLRDRELGHVRPPELVLPGEEQD